MAGHIPYKGEDASSSTFTILDSRGQLTSLLTQNRCKEVGSLGQRPTIHLEVCVSVGKLHSTFNLESDQVKKVGDF